MLNSISPPVPGSGVGAVELAVGVEDHGVVERAAVERVRVREDDGAAGRLRGAERRFELAGWTLEEELPHVGHRSGF